MKKLTLTALTTKYAVLTEVFFFIYVSMLTMGFGINGECSPSGANLTAIIVSFILIVSCGTTAINDFENKKTKI